MMLVQSRSKACSVCQKRKVKCDKSLPNCSQCVKDGWKCLGYKAVWKEKPRRDGGKGNYQYESQWVLALESKTQRVLKPVGNFQGSKVSNPIAEKRHGVESPRSLPNSSSYSLSRKLVWLLEEDMSSSVKIQSLGLFLLHIPSRLGHNKALDDATDCICSTYMSIFEPDGPGSNSNRHKYLLALKSLRQYVLDESEALSSNVLAAAVLLSWYEILAENLENGWLAHIRGCAKLIQARGPSRHHAGFDKALLYAEKGFVSSEELISCTPSFLDSPAWQSALYDDESDYHHSDWYLESLKVIANRVSRLSTFVFECKGLVHRIRQETHTVVEIRTVLERYGNLRREVQDHLKQDGLAPDAGTVQRPKSIITAKLFLTFLHLDANLYDILSLLNLPPFSEELSLQIHLATVYVNNDEEHFIQGKEQIICSSSDLTSAQSSPEIPTPNSPPFPDSLSNSQILNHLNASIAHSAISLKEQLTILREVNPLYTRRMTFLVHMVCAETRKRGAIHGVWGEIEDWLEGMHREGCWRESTGLKSS